MTEKGAQINPSEWLDIHSPLLFISSFETIDKNFDKQVNTDALKTASAAHLPLSGSVIPLSHICETMLQASALTIYYNEGQYENKALVFSAKTRLFKNISLSSRVVVYTNIVSYRRGIIKTESKLRFDDILYATGNFDYNRDLTDKSTIDVRVS